MFNRLLQLVLAFPTLMPHASAKTQKLSIAATEWAPLTSAETEHNGLLADIASEALKRMNCSTQSSQAPRACSGMGWSFVFHRKRVLLLHT